MKRDMRLVRLSREHTHALLLAQRIRQTLPAGSDEQVAELYSTTIAFWSAGLLPHFTAESECLLARLIRHVPADGEHVLRLQRDHLSIEAAVAAMRDATDMAARRAAMRDFSERMFTHVRWEENDLFPTAETTLTDHEMDLLGEDLAARLPEHPLPFWEAE